jgi:4,4'-diaponeurosporenoate glycosyltransferase
VIDLVFLLVLGLLAGFLLLLKIPCCRPGPRKDYTVSVVIPARNEEHNLPRLLLSLQLSDEKPWEVIVVDDHSSDATAKVATAYGATVLKSRELPSGWTGKTWACTQGAAAASGDLLLFLDADTWLMKDGFSNMLATLSLHRCEDTALSLLPYHETNRPYEELSIFFNLMMAGGAGGFGVFGKPKLFGQCLLISKSLYLRCGGHAAVSQHILENVAMSDHIQANGAQCACFSGKNVLHVRMFPEGVPQLCEGWTKAFASGAAASNAGALVTSIAWLSALAASFFAVLIASSDLRNFTLAIYAVFAAQIAWFGRQIGKYRWYSFALFPIPLFFYFILFSTSLLRKVRHQHVTWRGREI